MLRRSFILFARLGDLDCLQVFNLSDVRHTISANRDGIVPESDLTSWLTSNAQNGDIEARSTVFCFLRRSAGKGLAGKVHMVLSGYGPILSWYGWEHSLQYRHQV